MKTLKLLDHDTPGPYFQDLPKELQEAVSAALWDALQARSLPDTHPYEEKEAVEQIECRSRDGFISFSHNKGGLRCCVFTDLMGFWGGGYSVSHKGAQAEIKRQTEHFLEQARDATYECFKSFFDAQGIAKERCTYHELSELSEESGSSAFDEVVRFIQEAESECLGGNDNSIMLELRFLYHGCDKGAHSASISAAVNTEGPYHRQHIPWAPNVFCEGAKEVEITWKKTSALDTKLKRALKVVCEEVL
jgi:hypothetical protein